MNRTLSKLSRQFQRRFKTFVAELEAAGFHRDTVVVSRGYV